MYWNENLLKIKLQVNFCEKKKKATGNMKPFITFNMHLLISDKSMLQNIRATALTCSGNVDNIFRKIPEVEPAFYELQATDYHKNQSLR